MTTTARIQRIQQKLGVEADGILGPNTLTAIERAIGMSGFVSKAGTPVRASSFADPADVAAFRRCKAKGKSDQECFAVGDNGLGKWGADTTGRMPMCALPREEWENAGKTGGDKVRVRYKGHESICELGDTMPKYENIENGAGIDMNPALCKALHLTPPVLVEGVTWEWA